MQFDVNKLKEYKELIIVSAVFLLIFVIGINILVARGEKFSLTYRKYKTSAEKLKKAKEEIKQIENRENAALAGRSKLRPVYSESTGGGESITAFGTMFEDIVDYIKMNGLMLRSIEYDINPVNDKIRSSFPLLYNVCSVKAYVIGTYNQMQSFFKDMNAYPYFVNISEVKVVSYEKNKNYLLVNMTINLYSAKNKQSSPSRTDDLPTPSPAKK